MGFQSSLIALVSSRYTANCHGGIRVRTSTEPSSEVVGRVDGPRVIVVPDDGHLSKALQA